MACLTSPSVAVLGTRRSHRRAPAPSPVQDALARKQRQILLLAAIFIASMVASVVLAQSIDEPAAASIIRLTEPERQQLEEFRSVLHLDRPWREGALTTRPMSPAISGKNSVSPLAPRLPVVADAQPRKSP